MFQWSFAVSLRELSGLLGLVYVVQCGYSDQPTLVFTSLLYRHGDRSPIHTMPKENVPLSYWYEGLGQLSKIGMHQAYLLGEFFHQRYTEELKSKYLFNNYTRTQIYVRSTDVDRTLMSAQCQLSGLFKPDDEQVFVPWLKWQPIPIHTVPSSEDILLHGSKCPRIAQLNAEVTASEEYKKVNSDNKAFFEFLEDQTDLRPISLSNVGSVHNAAYIQDIHGVPFSWANRTVLDKLKMLHGIAISFKLSLKEKRKLYIGTLVGNIAKEMDVMAKCSSPRSSELYPQEKIHIYSAHDSTVSAFLSVFNAFNGTNPEYCSTVVVELYRDVNCQHFVEIWYKFGPLKSDKTSGSLYCSSSSNKRMERTSDCLELIRIPGCTAQCPLETFQRFVSDVIPVNRAKECQLKQQSNFQPRICSYTAAVILWLANGLFILYLVMKCYKRIRSRYFSQSRKERVVYSQLKSLYDEEKLEDDGELEEIDD